MSASNSACSFPDLIVNFASFVTVPIRFASFTIASNASCWSGLTDNKKRDCVSLNNSETASPDNATVAPIDVSPNTASVGLLLNHLQINHEQTSQYLLESLLKFVVDVFCSTSKSISGARPKILPSTNF